MTKKFPSNRKSNFVRLHITHKEKQKDSNMNTYSIEEVYRYLDLDILHINNIIFIKHNPAYYDDGLPVKIDHINHPDFADHFLRIA